MPLSSPSGRRHERVTGRLFFTENVTFVSAEAVSKAAGQFHSGFLQLSFWSRAQNLTEFYLKGVEGRRHVDVGVLEERRWGLCWCQGSGWKWCVADLLFNEPLSRAPEQKSDESAVWLKAVTTQQASMVLAVPLISLADAETWGHGKIWQESSSLATATPRRITWAMLNMPGVCYPEPGPPHLMQI